MSGRTRKAAEGYIRRGCAVIPVPAGSKNPNRRGWQNERITLEDVPRAWANGANIGLLTGEPSGWRVDVDLDCPEAVALADRFLPATLMGGRESSPRSHLWFVSEGAKTEKYRDTGGAMLVEVRSTGAQTVVAPSTHPSGDRYLWDEGSSEMVKMDASNLSRCVRELATAALIARHLPEHRNRGGGGRHDFALALAGYLLRPGRLEIKPLARILLAGWDAKGWPMDGDREEAKRDLEGILRDTEDRIKRGEKVQGGRTLESIEPRLPRTLAKFWGWGESPDTGPDAGDKERPDRRLEAVRFNEIPDPGRRRYLVDDLIPEGYPVLLHGDGGVAKSMLALSFGLALARGGRWLGRDLGEASPVLYLDFELDAPEQRRRVNRLARGEGLERVPDNLLYLSALGYPAREAFAAALEESRKHGVRLLILDSLGPALQGDAEAARDVIGFYQKSMEPFRAAGVTVLVIDHQARLQAGEKYQSKSAFGSVFKTNLARSVIQAEATERGENALTVRLRQKKHNFGSLAEPFEVRLTFTEEEVTLEEKTLDAADLAEEQTLNATDRVKMALELGPAYPQEIAEATGIVEKTVKNTLSRLKKKGEVEPTGEKDGRAEQVRLTASQRPNPYIGTGRWDDSDNPDFWRIVDPPEEKSPEDEEGKT